MPSEFMDSMEPRDVPEYIDVPGLGGKLLYEFACLSEKHKYGCCVVEFDKDDRYIYMFESGRGHDAEEKFVFNFPRLVRRYGRVPRTIHMLTKWNPCDRVCSGAIANLATKHPGICDIYVGYAEPYVSSEHGHSESETNVANAVRKVNFVYTHLGGEEGGMRPTTRIVCSMLGDDVIDAAKVRHFDRRRERSKEVQSGLIN